MQKQYEDNQEEIEIDLKDLFFELIKHWKFILLSTLLVGGILLFYSKVFITPLYESTSELYVLSKTTSITSLADIQMGSSLTNDYMVVVKGRPVIEQVISNLALEEDYKSLGNKIALNNPADSRILQITVTDPDPEQAKIIADEMAKVASAFIAEKMAQDPPTILKYGYEDGEPVSPAVGKNTIIGVVIGAILSIGIVVVLYLMNDTIMNAEDVEKKLGLHMLGSLPYEGEIDEDKKTATKKKTHTKSA